VKETEEILRAQVTEVCYDYCLQVWKEALDSVGMDDDSKLRKPKKVIYPPTMREVAPTTAGVIGAATSTPQPTEKLAAVVPLPADKPAVPTSQVTTMPSGLSS